MEQIEQKQVTGTQAIDRAADLLVRILDAQNPITLSELVSATGLAKGTTSRILSALERSGLIERGAISGFQVGPVLNQYAIRGGAYASLVSKMTPAMERIAQITRETVNLAVSGHSGIDNIAQVEGDYLLGSRNWVGESVPAHCSAAGKVLLAFGGCALPRTLTAVTTSTITNYAELDEELRKVRDRKYGVIRNELEQGLVAISVPVIGDHGLAIGAVSVSGPTERIQVSDEARIAHLIAQEISQIQRSQHEGAA